jgi:hypothetical protein
LSEIVFAMPILPQFPVNPREIKISEIPAILQLLRNPREVKIACRRLRDIQRLLTTAAGRSYISPALKACWP